MCDLDPFTVVIPTLNEGANITECLGRVCDSCRGAAPDFEVIVVDDGSTDTTQENVRTVSLSES